MSDGENSVILFYSTPATFLENQKKTTLINQKCTRDLSLFLNVICLLLELNDKLI